MTQHKAMARALSKFVAGFDYQKCTIFGFALSASHDTGSLLKIWDWPIDNVKAWYFFLDIHNLHQKSSVDHIGYGLAMSEKDKSVLFDFNSIKIKC